MPDSLPPHSSAATDATATPSTEQATWLIAAWPGMGNVAVISAAYLVRELGMTETSQLPSRDHFDIGEIMVRSGMVEFPRLPRGVFYRAPAVRGKREIIIFLAEAQPTVGAYRYAHELLDAAVAMGVARIITFASMASGLHPAANPRVFGVATDEHALAGLQRAEVDLLGDGQIGGLNGVLLAAAAEREIPAICLLGEIPFFAAAVPNPKAARAALSVFSVLSGIDISLTILSKQAETIDRVLIEAFEKLRVRDARDDEADRAARSDLPQSENEHEGESEAEIESDAEDDSGEDAPNRSVFHPSHSTAATPKPDEPQLDYAMRRKVEDLFHAARQDIEKAVPLKKELDRLGVFPRYQDRFLDLFRRA
jgi:predicted ATP-grasp superfamily ATP-dependent carboligase